jgi:hypothetical protein
VDALKAVPALLNLLVQLACVLILHILACLNVVLLGDPVLLYLPLLVAIGLLLLLLLHRVVGALDLRVHVQLLLADAGAIVFQLILLFS